MAGGSENTEIFGPAGRNERDGPARIHAFEFPCRSRNSPGAKRVDSTVPREQVPGRVGFIEY